jgi:putative isomerase
MSIYNDTKPADGLPGERITPVMFWPMWVGVADAEQGAGAAKYLDDPKHLATTWPMPCVSVSDPTFLPRNYWRGPTWVNLNWTAVRGLQRCGQTEVAEALRVKTLDLVARTPIIHEYYYPLTGDGLGSKNYGWTAALFIDLIMKPE